MKEITKEAASGIIHNRLPKGLFWYKDGDEFVAIDNSTGHAWTEPFDSFEKCKLWLENEDICAEDLTSGDCRPDHSPGKRALKNLNKIDIIKMRDYYDNLASSQISVSHRIDILSLIDYILKNEAKPEDKVIASYGISNAASMNIYDVVYGIDDHVVVGMNNSKRKTLKIYHNDKGAYFIFGRRRYYIHDFLRV